MVDGKTAGQQPESTSVIAAERYHEIRLGFRTSRLIHVATRRWPKQGAVFQPDLEERYQRFAELREDWLLNFGYNTARAYWADLDDILRWAVERGKDPLKLSDDDIKKYLALLNRRGYSKNTIRRRRTAWRGFARFVST